MRIRGTASSVVVALLAACGSSEDPLPTIAVQFSPATVRATFRGGGQSFNLPNALVTGTLSPMPSGGIYVVIVQDQPVLYWNPLSYLWKTATGFEAVLLFDPSLAAGTYTGKLTLLLCKDERCGTQYTMTGNELFYELTVAEPVVVSAWADGVPVSAGSTIQVRSGSTVRIEASEPSSFSEYTGGASASTRTTTATSWEAQVVYSVSTPGSTGYMDVEVFPLAEPQGSATVSIAVTE